MCGILGIKVITSNEIPSVEAIKNSLQQLSRRGPDYSDIKKLNDGFIAHTRLSIIDTTAAGNQPMTDSSGNYSLVFNGEIYNFQELKNNLLTRNYKFNSQSDTEVLLNHLIEFGEEGIKELNGCFAFAFADKKNNTLILARDPMGINPLFYYHDDQQLVFSSNIQSILTLLNNDYELNNIASYFRYGYIPGDQTLFKNILALPPGNVATITSDLKFKSKKISPSITIQPSSDSTDKGLEKELFQTIEDAVIKRLHANVPLGCFLSGGIDSSIIAALAFKNKTDLNTFSIGIGDQAYYDESAYAEEVAKYIGTHHQTIKITEQDFQERYADFMDSLDFPFADASAVNVFFLSEATRKKVTVALSGDGADELFGGYRKHAAFQMSKQKNTKTKMLQWLYPFVKNKSESRSSKSADSIRKIKRFNQFKNTPDKLKFEYLSAFGEDEFIKNLTGKSGISPAFINIGESTLNQMLLFDQKLVLPGDMLTKVDMMSMHHSLEVRTPFLDKNVVAFANQLPEKYKTEGKKGKIILRSTFQDLLPQTVFNRPKKGFEVPIEKWLHNKINYFEKCDFFKADFIQQQNIFDVKTAMQLLENFKNKANTATHFHFWAYIVFQEWFIRNKK